MNCTILHTGFSPLGQNDGASCRVAAVLDGDARTLHASLSFTTVRPLHSARAVSLSQSLGRFIPLNFRNITLF